LTLFTTVTKDYDRISMHGVRRILLQKQVECMGLSLHEVFIPKNGSNEEYDSIMKEEMIRFREKGISSVVFGDIFLEDVKNYRERNLSQVAMKGIFPIWNSDTADLARDFIASGFKAVVTCIDSNVLGKTFVGRAFDKQFISELPSATDPCGENGEFHSFVYDGPIFRKAILHTTGEVVLREKRFYYCDLVPLVDTKATPTLLPNR